MFNELNCFNDEFTINVVEILLHSYRNEKNSIEDKIAYEKHIKELYPKEFDDFLEYKQKVERRTPNLKQIYFDWIDGKIKKLDFDYFSPEGLDLTFMWYYEKGSRIW